MTRVGVDRRTIRQTGTAASHGWSFPAGYRLRICFNLDTNWSKYDFDGRHCPSKACAGITASRWLPSSKPGGETLKKTSPFPGRAFDKVKPTLQPHQAREHLEAWLQAVQTPHNCASPQLSPLSRRGALCLLTPKRKEITAFFLPFSKF